MNRFSKILYVTDSSTSNSAAFEQAVSLATANQAKLTVAGVMHDLNRVKASIPMSIEIMDAMIKLRQEKLEVLASAATNAGLEVEIKVFSGKAFVDIIREVLEHSRDLVIKPIAQQAHLNNAVFGGTDMKLLRKCPCPVWLIKSTEQHGDKDILVALDYDPDNAENEALNSRILELATSLALSDACQLHIAHVWCLKYESFLRSGRTNHSQTEVDQMVTEEEQTRKAWLLESVKSSQGKDTYDFLKPKLHLVQGDARVTVPELTRRLGIELVVMGTVARTGIPGYLMGNTAETILNQIDCSVLAMKPEEFVSPVTVGGL